MFVLVDTWDKGAAPKTRHQAWPLHFRTRVGLDMFRACLPESGGRGQIGMMWPHPGSENFSKSIFFIFLHHVFIFFLYFLIFFYIFTPRFAPTCHNWRMLRHFGASLGRDKLSGRLAGNQETSRFSRNLYFYIIPKRFIFFLYFFIFFYIL